MVFQCRCEKCENPVKNYRIDCTLDELCDVAPRDRMHIHESPPDTKPTDPAVLAASLIDRESNGDESCAICHTDFERGESVRAPAPNAGSSSVEARALQKPLWSGKKQLR